MAAVYTPKDFDITRIMRDIVELVRRAAPIEAAANGHGPSANGSA